MRHFIKTNRAHSGRDVATCVLGAMLLVWGGVSAQAAPDAGAQSDTQATATDAAAPAADGAAAVAQPVVPRADAAPAVAAAYVRLQDKAFMGRYAKDDVEAASEFYGALKDPLWVADSAFNERGKALAAEIAKAVEWGLDASAFALPDVNASLPDAQALGGAEAQLTLAALTYARHARGGRVRPLSISQLMDLTPPIRDPKVVLSEVGAASAPAEYLTGLHPRHEQFQRLRAELVKRLGPVEPEAPRDEALLVKLPVRGATTVKPGSLHPDISLLRKRLKIPASFAGQDTLYNEELAEAVRAFQTEKRLKATGQLDKRTRAALNKEGEPEQRENPRDTQRILVNMERWRWMPEDMGAVHVINNTPEFMTRTYKNGEVIFEEKIIVGLSDWPTPSFSAEMKTIVFNPSWGVPDGIKAKELKPRLQRAGGGGFFEQLFGGGSSGGAAVLKAYGLTAYRNGRPVDPNSVNWGSADLRAYSFIQPPGAKNPLGFVKFMFPNTHDVYMHDTIQRELFSQSRRAYSHGCIRVNNPGRFAEVLLEQDKGWSKDRVSSARRSSETVALDNHIWVHNVYLTAWVQDDGKVRSFSDIYGLDSRVSRAIGGKSVPSYQSSQDDLETASISDDEDSDEPQPKKKSQKKQASAKPKSTYKVPGSFSEAMSGLTSN